MVIHCYAGISRSTAAAFIATCALRPDRDEAEIARELREPRPRRPRIGASSRWRMHCSAATGALSAIAAIGRGADAFEGEPFRLTID